MKLLKRILKSEAGQALPMALVLLVLGGFLVVPTLAFMTTNLTANRIVKEKNLETYAADAGIQYAYYKFAHDVDFDPGTDPLDFPPELNPVNGCDVTLAKTYIDQSTYKITSTAIDQATGKSTTIVAYIQAAGSSPFDYAVVTLDGDLCFETVTASITSDPPPSPPYEEDLAWITGNICLKGTGNFIYGTATLTGTCSQSTCCTGPTCTCHCENVLGGVKSGAPMERPAWLDDQVNNYIASTAVAEPGCSGPVESSWDKNAGTYYGALQVTGNMKIDGSGTNYTFTGPVCVGGNLIILSSTNVEFQGPVKVTGYVSLAGNGTVDFQDVLYIGGYLDSTQNRSAKFEGQVAVNGSSRISGRIVNYAGHKCPGADWDVVFLKTIRVTETPPSSQCYSVYFGSDRRYNFYDVVYSTESIELAGDSGSDMTYTKAVIADCDLKVSNNSKVNAPTTTSPLLVSRHGDVKISGGGVQVSAIVYAPEGQASVETQSRLEGAIVAKSAKLAGVAILKYPVILRDRGDLHGGNSLCSIVSYSIDPVQ
jgi:hypothetical protein